MTNVTECATCAGRGWVWWKDKDGLKLRRVCPRCGGKRID